MHFAVIVEPPCLFKTVVTVLATVSSIDRLGVLVGIAPVITGTCGGVSLLGCMPLIYIVTHSRYCGSLRLCLSLCISFSSVTRSSIYPFQHALK